MITLNEEEEDALKEILNIGVGTGAKVLGQMLGNEYVELGIPRVDVTNSTHIIQSFVEFNIFSSVQLEFTGLINGMAILSFSKASGDALIAKMSEDFDEETEMEAMREGVLSELGNIVINGVMGTIANLLNEDLSYQLPVYREDVQNTKFVVSEFSTIISANVSFKVQDLESEGYLHLAIPNEEYKPFVNQILASFGV